MDPRKENACPPEANGNEKRSDCKSVFFSFMKTFLRSKTDAKEVKEPTNPASADGKKKRAGLRQAPTRFYLNCCLADVVGDLSFAL